MPRFRADLLHSPARGRIERIEDALVCVDTDGEITSVSPFAATQGDDLTDLRPQGVLIPGLVDLHIHAPQFPQLGTALDVPLEDWLWRYTFPLEARYDDVDFARKVYDALVRRLLANGTTTAVYFATIHGSASLALAQACVDLGQRALVGRVAMDHPEACPDDYRDENAETAIRDTADFIDAVRAIPGNRRVEPAITPRFIPACTDAALRGLGELAARTGAPVQTHCSESDWEHRFVHDRCGTSDTRALDSFGLLTRRTVLAHAGFIDNADMDLIHRRGSGIAHCPLSNLYFANAVFPLRRALDKSLHVGLGTDISGGPSAFLLDNARAITSSWDGNAHLSVFLEMDVAENRQRQMASEWLKLDHIDDTKVITRQQALEEFQALSGFGDVLQALPDNPLPPLIVVFPDSTDPVTLGDLENRLAEQDGVDLVQLDVEWVRRLHALIELGERLISALTRALAAAVVLVVVNTIRLGIESRRDEIVVVKIVGGTDGFVRRPFLYTGFCYGFAGGVVAMILVQSALWWLGGPIDELLALYNSEDSLTGMAASSLLVMPLFSGILGLLGAWLAVGRHLGEIEPNF